jgi:uncharacterized protein DUF6916
MADLTEAEFSRHLNTGFDLSFGEEQLQLKLVAVKAYLPQAHEESGMERFSLFFDGPVDRYLPQRMYHLTHAAMGELDIFLVPIEKKENAFRYEAVFNYYKGQGQ